MFRIKSEKFKIVSKRVELPKGELNIQDLTISFNEMYRDYVIYYPGSVDKYITWISDIELGFGPRYLLIKLLREVEKANPDGTVDNGSIVVKTIPQLPEPLTRRLGKLSKSSTYTTSTSNEESVDWNQYKDTNNTIEKKIDDSINEDTTVKKDPANISVEEKYK